jgi:hypothetical protein
MDLEFLAYWLGRMRVEKECNVRIEPYAAPPHLNSPGRMLSFGLEGYRGEDGAGEPDEVAAWIRKGFEELDYRRRWRLGRALRGHFFRFWTT